MEITCKDCWAYGDTHSSCFKVRAHEVNENTPACKNIKYIKECKKDCALYNDINNCPKMRNNETFYFACEKIVLRKEIIEALNRIKGELTQEESLTNTPSKTKKLAKQ